MSSESRAPSQIPTNKLYVNIAAALSTITDANLSTVTWQLSQAGPTGYEPSTLLGTAGAAVLRDMGKTVYLPAGATGAHVSTVLRKVQLIVPNYPGGVSGAAGTTNNTDYLTGYIQLGGLTYGGGSGNGAVNAAPINKFVRLN